MAQTLFGSTAREGPRPMPAGANGGFLSTTISRARATQAAEGLRLRKKKKLGAPSTGVPAPGRPIRGTFFGY